MFKIIKKSKISQARLGKIITKRGVLSTPFFMPIATRGAIKNLSPQDLKDLKAEIILSNTYHLFLKPGLKIIKHSKGLNNFIGWDKSILTDSGGYQVFSLAKKRKIKQDGVEFQSEISGEKVFLTPEKAIKIQRIIDSDLMMVLDECLEYPVDYKKAAISVERTTKWAIKSQKEYLKKKNGQLLFGIVQGSIYFDLRKKSVQDLVKQNFDGYAIGGIFVGEPVKKSYFIIKKTAEILPFKKPRYLMGAGKPEQILKSVRLGVDMFDCVIPTRNARHGLLYTNLSLKNSKLSYKKIHITNAKYKNSILPLDKKCACYTCQNFSQSYLRHLFAINENLGQRLATIHNLAFYLNLMKEIRNQIKIGKL